MEYVDGEDLRSLLRRIGRLPGDKALEIARRLCAGLAAAHEKGVLHRDLKPANIMIDGRGQVLIMDFGLAGLADQIEAAKSAAARPPTWPPSSSPERKSRSAAISTRWAWCCTRCSPARAARTPQPLQRSLVKDIDPAVERVILRCLEADPRSRPASALAVAAALPGGDPLAAALAAGETPTPGMVAAAGDTEGISVRTAGICLGVVLAGLVAVAVLGSKTNILQKTPFDKPPEALEQKARDLLQSFGYTEPPADRAYGFSYDTEFQQYGEQRRIQRFIVPCCPRAGHR